MMNNYGFVKVAAAVPQVRVADCDYNAEAMMRLMTEADAKGVEIVVFPELSITGYTCGDLFAQQLLLNDAEAGLEKIVRHSATLEVIAIVGMPLTVDSQLLNVAAVIHQGKIAGFVPKTYLPNSKEYYEKRWFVSGLDIPQKTSRFICGQSAYIDRRLLFRTSSACFGIELCEDMWATVPPSSFLALSGAHILFNLSASNDYIGKHAYRCSILAQQSARCLAGYVYSACGFGESTTDVVFGGNALIYENGTQIACGKRFSFDEQLVIGEIDVDRLRMERQVNTTFAGCRNHLTSDEAVTVDIRNTSRPIPALTRSVPAYPFVPHGAALDERCEEIFSIQTTGLAQRLMHAHARHAVVGISGGLDSTLALLVCALTFDKLNRPRTDIIGVTMPGFGTTDRTYTNALALMRGLGVSMREISIKEACELHFRDIGHDAGNHDAVYENAQARERTQILMDMANQKGGLVVGTGDLSELALGWATYNGDHISMYGVNSSIPKTLVRHLVKWVALNSREEEVKATLLDIVDTPISPELIPADEQGNIKQKTEDLVGPYDLHDFFLYYFIRFGFKPSKIRFLAMHAFGNRYDEATVNKWLETFLRRFFSQQFKRSCLPDGPKVGSISLSPRGDWRMPSDASVEAWLRELKE
ncbi:MAG: NAD(+) synthase [Prevotellaceae bacterium]|nr:NAD(+) synthase [Prevotellaceae bacterium]